MIKCRRVEEAAEILRRLLVELKPLQGTALKQRFMAYAAAHSNCGTGPAGGGATRDSLAHPAAL